MSDFTIKWKGPATDEEVTAIMNEIKRQALEIAHGDIVQARCRREAALKVVSGINAVSAGYAVLDYCMDPTYDNEKECYVSTVMVAKDHGTLRKYLTNTK